jgi:hypothetical protein
LGSAPLLQLGGLLQVVAGLGYFLALTGDRQALHDRIAGTAVYPAQSLSAKSQESKIPASEAAELIRQYVTRGDADDIIVERLAARGAPMDWIRKQVEQARSDRSEK